MGMDKRDPEVWARANLAVLFIFNIYSIGFWTRSTHLTSVLMPLSLCVFAFLFFYYGKSRFLRIEKRYDKESPRQKLWGSIAVISYAVISVVLLFYPLIKAVKPIE